MADAVATAPEREHNAVSASPAPGRSPGEINLSAPAAAGEDPLDRLIHASIAGSLGGFSPMSVGEAWLDWASHLAVSPARRLELVKSAWSEQSRVFGAACNIATRDEDNAPCNRTLPHDKRFHGPEWRQWPFAPYAEALLAAERWWDDATSKVHGASPHHLSLLRFLGRQVLDMASPSNFVVTNPVVIDKTVAEGGANLLRGTFNFWTDIQRAFRRERSDAAKAFAPGKTVAVTKGAVVKRTALAEIIQYSPTTSKVRAEPVVIVPAWIMKYYILDLSPANSLVKHLVDEGFTVFVISWKNPGRDDRDIGFDDYRRLGVLPAISTALAITGAKRAHLAGYCVGGTLAAVTAAAMARDFDDRLQSLTLLAAQTDFDEAGELKLFIDESQLAAIEDIMWERGVFEGNRMARTFNLLRSNDLIWSRIVHHYLMGEPEKLDDLSAWSTDATRLPYRMHNEYLRNLYLTNDLAEGRFGVDGRSIAPQDIRAPIFAVGTEWDHVAPWRSVYKIHNLTDTEVTFALTNGGHNQGIISPPGRKDRHYRLSTTGATEPRHDPEAWFARAHETDGSWWPAWFGWLGARSGPFVAPPPLGRPDADLAPLDPAPGVYVLG
jgi:polyhydroxyalkanoate synthase subunit PhaC